MLYYIFFSFLKQKYIEKKTHYGVSFNIVAFMDAIELSSSITLSNLIHIFSTQLWNEYNSKRMELPFVLSGPIFNID
jgi:hypothetical protein